MGFDVYGIKPKENTELPKWIADIDNLEFDEKWKKIEEKTEEHPEGRKEEYWKARNEWESDNRGVYFRNNVWWWRPLWEYVCTICDDIISDEEMNGGCVNDGILINENKATSIAKRLSEKIADGSVQEYEQEFMSRVLQAKADNEEVDKETKALREEVIKATGDKNIAPVNYPKKYKTRYDKIRAKENWDGHYPFNTKNVEQFAKFCNESGGFEIW